MVANNTYITEIKNHLGFVNYLHILKKPGGSWNLYFRVDNFPGFPNIYVKSVDSFRNTVKKIKTTCASTSSVIPALFTWRFHELSTAT